MVSLLSSVQNYIMRDHRVYACSRKVPIYMALKKSLDESKIIAALLCDINMMHGDVFSRSSLQKTLRKVNSRLAAEGLCFLTKTLPRIGKYLDKALTGTCKFKAIHLRLKSQKDSELPIFMGEFLNRVFDNTGQILPQPCVSSVGVLRQFYYLFYKYELPYSAEQELEVIAKFEKTEQDLFIVDAQLQAIGIVLDKMQPTERRRMNVWTQVNVAREARILLSRVFAYFDPTDIDPMHGPGVVATKQRLWSKYEFKNISRRITDVYPLDAYFYASAGHVCDVYDAFKDITDMDLPARVILVPKDSRGPRLISCEPVDFQWVQGGLRKAIVNHVETSDLTRFNVFFTNQQPNQFGALLGSQAGKYATLDLNEASDRISVELVRLLFPAHLFRYLEACRSSATVLPNGKVLQLRKFAPMGSSLCFPILALSIWAILTAAAPDRDTREGILVYGDDVIVPASFAVDAMEQLESFGLKINHDKSYTSGLFRESCGTDAFKGVNVTPVRLRTVWSSSRSPESYTSWIAYANSFYDKMYYATYDYITGCLHRLYGTIPDKGMNLSCPSLANVPNEWMPKRHRTNHSLQKREWSVLDVSTPNVKYTGGGWISLLRYFAEKANSLNRLPLHERLSVDIDAEAFSVGSYTHRHVSKLTRKWR